MVGQARAGSGGPPHHLGRHAALRPPCGAVGDQNRDVGTVAQAAAGLSDAGDEGVVLAAGQDRQAADAAVERGAEREAGAGMVAVARSRIVRRRIVRILDPAHGGPVALDPDVQLGERRIGVVLRIDHQASADDLGALERPKVGHEPGSRHPRVGIRGEQGAIGASVRFEPGGAGIERHPPGGADMGLRPLEMRLDQPDREGGGLAGRLHRPHGGDRPVGTIVGDDQDAQARVGRDAVLDRQRAQQARQAPHLVAGGDADDRLHEPVHGQACAPAARSIRGAGRSARSWAARAAS